MARVINHINVRLFAVVFFFREKSIHLKSGMEEGDCCYTSALVVVTLLGLWIIKRLYIDELVENFHEKYVLLTGCDSGFGRETALRLDSLGFNVFATCLTSEGQTQLIVRCSKRLKAIHLDVTNSQEIREAFKFVVQNLPENEGKLFDKILIQLRIACELLVFEIDRDVYLSSSK